MIEPRPDFKLTKGPHSFPVWASYGVSFVRIGRELTILLQNYINPGYGLSLVDTLWNASSYRQPLEQEGNPMT